MTGSMSGLQAIPIRAHAIGNTTATVARILCGLLFAVAGASGLTFVFGHITPPQAPTPLAQQFQEVFFHSHWVVAVDTVQLFCGLLLVFNRFTPLALVILGGVLFNIVCFHVTMAMASAPPAAVALVLWVLASWPYRRVLAPIFVDRPDLRA